MSTGMFPSRSRPDRSHATGRAIRGFRQTDGTHGELVSMAGLLRVQNKPLPPLADYEAWMQSAHGSARAASRHTTLDARKMRRAVQMIRNGCSPAEAARTLGAVHNTLLRWLAQLPPELAA